MRETPGTTKYLNAILELDQLKFHKVSFNELEEKDVKDLQQRALFGHSISQDVCLSIQVDGDPCSAHGQPGQSGLAR